jgi:dethiobiotin synthetase
MQNGGGDEEEDDVAMLSQAAKFTYCDPKPYVYPRGSSPHKSMLFLYSKHIAWHIYDIHVSYKIIAYNLIIFIIWF